MGKKSSRARDPDLSLAMQREARHFDGNVQRHVRVWHWMYLDRLQQEDFDLMVRAPALDWVIFPLPEPI